MVRIWTTVLRWILAQRRPGLCSDRTISKWKLSRCTATYDGASVSWYTDPPPLARDVDEVVSSYRPCILTLLPRWLCELLLEYEYCIYQRPPAQCMDYSLLPFTLEYCHKRLVPTETFPVNWWSCKIDVSLWIFIVTHVY